MLDQTIASNDDLHKQQIDTAQTAKQIDAELQKAEVELDEMDRQLLSMQDSLKHAKGENKDWAAKVSKLQNTISTLKAAVKKGSPKKKELDRAKQEFDKVKEEHALLIK